MKIKLLFVPTLIIAIIIISIWWVYPLWSNGVDGIREKMDKYETLKQKQEKLTSQISNINKLSQEIDDKAEQTNYVYSFLPKVAAEEDMVDKIQFLVTNEGNDMKMEKIDAKYLQDNSGLVSNEGVGSSSPQAANIDIKTADYSLEAVFSGPYAKVKDVLGKIYAIKRYNKILGLKIEKESQGNDNTDNLTCTIDLGLNYYVAPVLKIANIEDPIFDKPTIDWDFIDKANQVKNIDLVDLQLPTLGKTNPFLPK